MTELKQCNNIEGGHDILIPVFFRTIKMNLAYPCDFQRFFNIVAVELFLALL